MELSPDAELATVCWVAEELAVVCWLEEDAAGWFVWLGRFDDEEIPGTIVVFDADDKLLMGFCGSCGFSIDALLYAGTNPCPGMPEAFDADDRIGKMLGWFWSIDPSPTPPLRGSFPATVLSESQFHQLANAKDMAQALKRLDFIITSQC